MKIYVLTTLWKRHDLADVVLTQLEWLRKNSDCELGVVCVGSEGEVSRQLAEKHKFDYVEHENVPLGAKHNAGCKFLKDQEYDYLMVIGSDDLLNLSALNQLITAAKENPNIGMIGFRDIYFLSTLSSRAIYWKGYVQEHRTIGAGRLIKKQLIDACDGRLWENDARRNLDSVMMRRIARKTNRKIRQEVLELDRGSILCDVKSVQNIWSFSDMEVVAKGSVSVDPRRILQGLAPAVRRRLQGMMRQGKDPASKVTRPRSPRSRARITTEKPKRHKRYRV